MGGASISTFDHELLVNRRQRTSQRMDRQIFVLLVQMYTQVKWV